MPRIFMFRVRALCLAALIACLPCSHAAAGAIVPSFERFHASGNGDAVRGGELLLGELSCVSCHEPDAARAARILRRQAPILDGVGNRVKRSYLRKFLSDPHAVKPGT